MKYVILKGDVPNNIIEYFNGIELSPEEIDWIKLVFGEGNSIGKKIKELEKCSTNQ